MRTRSIGLSLFATAAIIVSACGGAATPAPASTAPTAPPASVAPTDAPPPTEPGKVWKVGVVTDVGTLDDKNFNQFSWEGAQAGAAAIGGEARPIVTQQSADYAKNIQSFLDQQYDIIVTIGFALGDATAIAAKANPSVWFIGVDTVPCLDANGDPDPTFGCAGDPAALLPNLQGVVFAEAEPGYLAGIAAANITKSKVIGAIGGAAFIPPVVSYIKGYINGAHSVDPTIQVKVAYVSDDLNKAFNDPAGGKAFATQFIQQNAGLDVLFQVAGKTGNGVLAAACDANINGIGVDVDQHESAPETAKCTVTSAEKKLSLAVQSAVERAAAGTAKGGAVLNNAANDGIGLSPFYEFESLFSDATKAAIQAAFDGFKNGSVDPCAPSACNTPFE